MKRPTQKDLAAALNLSASTISLALRKHRSIPAATQDRVFTMARELGYRQDARMAQHMAYIRSRQKRTSLLPLAYVHNFASALETLQNDGTRIAFTAASQRANELGYYLEEFWINEPGMTYRRLQRILKSRSIEGIYLQIDPEDLPAMGIEQFAAVANGPPFKHSQVHSVFPDAMFNFDLLFKKIAAAGYRRPGVCQWGTYGNHIYQSILPKTLSHFLEQHPGSGRIPVLRLQATQRESDRKCADWLQRWKPDVILTNDAFPFLIKNWIDNKQALLSWDTSNQHTPHISGIDRNLETVSRVSIEQLVGMINRNERGSPSNPYSIQIKGHWVEGRTFPVRSD